MKKYILCIVIVTLCSSGEAFPKLPIGISHHDSTANNLAAIDGHYGGSTSEQTKERPTLRKRSPDTPPDLKRSGTIVFSSSQNGNQEIYLLDLFTGRQTNLTNNRFDDGYPRLSPDGKKIAFATNRDGSWEVYLMNADGSDQRNLTRNREGNGYMDWSPDSQSLVFASTRYGNKNNDIYTIRADGSGLKRLTNHPAEDVHPVWAPDGRRIAFASERDGNREIYLMNTDGTNLIRLTNNRWYDDYPAWSPDGAQIAFASDRDSGRSDRLDIYTMNANGLNVRRVVSDPADDRHPAWSPDGKMIAFTSDREGDRDIFVTRTDGTSLIWLVSSRGNDEHPHWTKSFNSPDHPAPPDPSENKWMRIRAGESSGGFAYRKNGIIYFDGNTLCNCAYDPKSPDESRLILSPVSPMKKYRLALCSQDYSSDDGYILSVRNRVVVAKSIVPTGWSIDAWIRWSPDERYALVYAVGEVTMGDMAFVDLNSGRKQEIHFKHLIRNSTETQNLDSKTIEWLAPTIFQLRLDVRCNPYELGQRCDYDRILRSYYAQVDLRTLNISYSDYRKPNTPSNPTGDVNDETRLRSFRSLSRYFVIDYPQNWNAEIPGKSSVEFMPDKADQGEMIHYASFGYMDNINEPLDTTLNFSVGVITRYRPYLREPSGVRHRTQIEGRTALATYVKGRNRSGRDVTFWILAQRRGSGVFNFHFLAPDDEWDKYRPIFEAMLRSFKASFN